MIRHGHRNTILGVQWNKNGNWLLTGSRDQLVRVYDIRTMKEMQSFKGHKREVQCMPNLMNYLSLVFFNIKSNAELIGLAWHPVHESLFASGGYEGALYYWLVGFAHFLLLNFQGHLNGLIFFCGTERINR